MDIKTITKTFAYSENPILDFISSEKLHMHGTCYGINFSILKNDVEFIIVLPLSTKEFQYVDHQEAFMWMIKKCALFNSELNNHGIKV